MPKLGSSGLQAGEHVTLADCFSAAVERAQNCREREFSIIRARDLNMSRAAIAGYLNITTERVRIIEAQGRARRGSKELRSPGAEFCTEEFALREFRVGMMDLVLNTRRCRRLWRERDVAEAMRLALAVFIGGDDDGKANSPGGMRDRAPA